LISGAQVSSWSTPTLLKSFGLGRCLLRCATALRTLSAWQASVPLRSLLIPPQGGSPSTSRVCIGFWLGSCGLVAFPLCGPVGPVPGFDRARSCGLGVDCSACKCMLQALGSSGMSESPHAGCAPLAVTRAPPPSSASSAGIPGSPNLGIP
jgi:hypothetical protein